MGTHPSVHIEKILKTRKWSYNTLAKESGIRPGRVSEIMNRKRRVTPDLALKLEKALGVKATEWLNAQVEYDLFKHMAPKYKITRYFYKTEAFVVVRRGLTEEEAKLHCKSPESCSKTAQSAANKRRTIKFGHWYDKYELDRGG